MLSRERSMARKPDSFGLSFLAFAVCGVVLCQGCSPKWPIVVTNPVEPWEESVLQERAAEKDEEARRYQERLARQTEEGLGKEKPPDEHNPIVIALVDIVAFPVRGAAWLVHAIL
jgi:hypothetical protein